MKFLFIGSVVLSIATASVVRVAPLVADQKDHVPDEYIVMLREPEMGAQMAQNDDYNGYVFEQIYSLFGNAFAIEDRLIHKYNLGFAAVMTPQDLARARLMQTVDFIEQSQVVKVSDLQESPINWGLKRVSQRALPLTDKYEFVHAAGEGVDVYVIDNGVLTDHEDFEGRAINGIVVPAGEKAADGNHGTHVASTIAGAKFGIAKKANIINVKVLSSSGYGTTADVLRGIEWAAQQHQMKARQSNTTKSVANMSLGGGKSAALDMALTNAIRSGLQFAVAAGNDNRDACKYSPAGVADAVTVGATDIRDRRAYFSNFGECVDIFGPGVDITAAWNDDAASMKTISGTSMASPHVCGVMALLLSENDFTPAELKARLLQLSTPNLVKRPGRKSPNKLLFSDPKHTVVDQPQPPEEEEPTAMKGLINQFAELIMQLVN